MKKSEIKPEERKKERKKGKSQKTKYVLYLDTDR